MKKDLPGILRPASMLHLARRDMLGLMGAAAAFGLTRPSLAQGTPKQGGVLKVATPFNPSTMDPATGRAGNDHVFLYTIYDTLIEYDPTTLQARPGIAESWKYTDPKTLVLNIRSGVLFHDGTACNAEAIKWNLDRNRGHERSNIKPDVATIASVEVTGPNQVTVRLSQPDTALPLILADRAGMMVSPKAVEELGAEHDRKPVGAGPWKFVSWANQDRLIVTRNENYWKPGLPHLDGIEFAIIPEVNTGLRSVVAGQNDFVYFLGPQQKPVIDRAKNLDSVIAPTLYSFLIWLNYSKPPVDDVRVRLAMNYAIDRDKLNQATMAGLGEPSILNLPSSHWAYTKSLEDFYAFDPDKAKKLLAEAGHKDGVDIDLFSTPDQRAQQRLEVVTEDFRKVGIRLKVTTAPNNDATARYFGERQGCGYMSAFTGRPDPTQLYQVMYAKDSYYNASRLSPVPELEPAIYESRSSEDTEERKKVFAKLQRIVLEQALCVPLTLQPELDAMAKTVKGYKPNLLGKPRFENVWLEA